MKKAFRKSLKRQASFGYFSNSPSKSQSKNDSKGDSPKGDKKLPLIEPPILWQALAKKYQFNYPRDWYRIEAHWLNQIESFQEQPIDCPGRDAKMNNAITRISQCNESYQLCNSLPRSFIVPKDLKDFTLMNSMSTVIKNHRVPIISYCCPIEYRRNFIIRCASSDQQVRVIETLSKVVKPLKVLNLTSIAPKLESVVSAHKKLLNVCKLGDEAINFISKSGKWLNIISLALKLVKETTKILLTEASVILIEDEDRGWNSVVSSLVQLILEPHRRTIDGLESLISKEWIYLSGGQIDYSKPDLMFTLFLDCIYQIYLQNTSEFEFTSEYLRYLFKAQFATYPSQLAASEDQVYEKLHNTNDLNSSSSTSSSSSSGSGRSNNNNNTNINIMKDKDKNMNSITRTNGNNIISKSKTYTNDENKDMFESGPQSYKPASISLVDLNFTINNINSKLINNNNYSENNNNRSDHQAGITYNILMFNPFYNADKDLPIVEVSDHIANMKLWSSLYMNWQPRVNYGCIEETIYFQLDPPPGVELSYLKS